VNLAPVCRRFGMSKKQEIVPPSSPAASVVSHASSGQSGMSACSSDDIQPFSDDHASTSAASADLDPPSGPALPRSLLNPQSLDTPRWLPYPQLLFLKMWKYKHVTVVEPCFVCRAPAAQ